MEQPDAAEGHRDVVFIAGVDDLLVADGAAGLNDGGHAGAAGPLDVVAEGEERIRAEGHAGDLAEVGFLFLGGQGAGCWVKVSAQTSSPMTSSGVSPM